jgi:cell wall-associated NlpC family hydrolase
MTPDQKTAVVSWANELAGVRYRHLGRDPERGLDCVGFALECYKGAGIVTPEIADGLMEYSLRPSAGRLHTELMTMGFRRRDIHEAQLGDIVEIRVGAGTGHCGIVMGTMSALDIQASLPPGFWVSHSAVKIRSVVNQYMSFEDLISVWNHNG